MWPYKERGCTFVYSEGDLICIHRRGFFKVGFPDGSEVVLPPQKIDSRAEGEFLLDAVGKLWVFCLDDSGSCKVDFIAAEDLTLLGKNVLNFSFSGAEKANASMTATLLMLHKDHISVRKAFRSARELQFYYD